MPPMLDRIARSARSAAALAVVSALAFTGAAYAAPYSSLYVFGDSLSDSGNVFTFTTAIDALDGVDNFPTIPAAPYVAGRFSNGFNYADLLNQKLFGTSSGLTPSFAGGTNYAVGGAQTGMGNIIDGLLPGVPPSGMQAQLASYKAKLGAGSASPNGLYVVYGGPNDMLSMLSAAQADPLNAITIKNQAIQTAVDNLHGILTDLSAVGAQHFLIPNLPDLGATPRLNGDPIASSFAHLASVEFNDKLAAMLTTFDAQHAGDDVHSADVFSAFNDVLANPAKFGFTNIDTACFPGTPFAAQSGSACADPEHYVFWDDIHPTAHTNQIMADLAFAAAVPEAQEWVMLACGLLLLSVIARRRID